MKATERKPRERIMSPEATINQPTELLRIAPIPARRKPVAIPKERTRTFGSLSPDWIKVIVKGIVKV
ncbi:MAG: hypothetical protein ACE5J0_01680, partial [Candidatus Paceibacterales bacterium]